MLIARHFSNEFNSSYIILRCVNAISHLFVTIEYNSVIIPIFSNFQTSPTINLELNPNALFPLVICCCSNQLHFRILSKMVCFFGSARLRLVSRAIPKRREQGFSTSCRNPDESIISISKIAFSRNESFPTCRPIFSREISKNRARVILGERTTTNLGDFDR